MPDVADPVLVGHLSDVVKHRREVVLAKLVEAEVPELSIVDCHRDMLPAVDVSSIVPEPNVVAFFNEAEGKAIPAVVDESLST